MVVFNYNPIIEKFPYLTPYNYASDNLVTMIDLWGMQGIIPSPNAKPISTEEAKETIKFVVEMAIDLSPIGDLKDIKEGVEEKNGWQIVLGAIGLIPGGDLFKGVKKGADLVDEVHDLAKVGEEAQDVAKAAENLDDVARAEKRAAKLSKVERSGKDFTKAGKEAVIDVNKAKNDEEGFFTKKFLGI